MSRILDGGDPVKPQPIASGNAADNVPLVGVLLTIDERTCISVCTTNQLPGSPDAPSPPSDAQLGQPDYGPGATVEEGLPEDKQDDEEAIPVESTGVEIKCETTGEDKMFVGPTGKSFRVECPRGCGKSD